MDKGTVLKIVADFGRALESEGIKPQKIILFGSYSTGTQREDSDIDLVVISQDFTGKDYWARIDILSNAIFAVFKPIEAIAMTPDEWERGDSLIVDFARHGEVVYG
jgi:predicted nucleotidyltransferase